MLSCLMDCIQFFQERLWWKIKESTSAWKTKICLQKKEGKTEKLCLRSEKRDKICILLITALCAHSKATEIKP